MMDPGDRTLDYESMVILITIVIAVVVLAMAFLIPEHPDEDD
jgi:hypothetical protein